MTMTTDAKASDLSDAAMFLPIVDYGAYSYEISRDDNVLSRRRIESGN